MPVASAQQTPQRIETEHQTVDEGRRRLQLDIDARVKAIGGLRADLDGKVRDLVRECEELRRTLRRAGQDDVGRYLLYQEAQRRLAGVFSQALRRVQAADRFLEAANAEREERALRERQAGQRERVREVRKSVASLQVPRDDDFEFLYEVTDAS